MGSQRGNEWQGDKPCEVFVQRQYSFFLNIASWLRSRECRVSLLVFVIGMDGIGGCTLLPREGGRNQARFLS
jgi:hypothetical protein